MKLIATSSELREEFKRLSEKYKTYHWAIAWAGVGSEHYEILLKNQKKISKLVVGIHFYQTHPDFIQTFQKNKNVQFVNQPQGTFHPKIYLFFNSESEWEVILGSSNFTKEGFNRNTEANILVSNKDKDSDSFLKRALNLLDESWKQSKVFSSLELLQYRNIWENQRSKLRSLSGLYGSSNNTVKPIYEVPVINMTWKEFVNKVKLDKSHGLDKRLEVIETAQKLFTTVKHFCDLSNEQRKFIAGVKSSFNENWGYFGSMKGRGDFVQQIILNNKDISAALDQIPIKGQITNNHYENYIKFFTKAFPGNYIGTASRLLSMKRPDVFFCLTSKNQRLFCADFIVNKKEINYSGYWEHVVMRIYDSEWWLKPNPTNKMEQRISDSRAAFLDSIYYEDKSNDKRPNP
jgi:hypothetical protein